MAAETVDAHLASPSEFQISLSVKAARPSGHSPAFACLETLYLFTRDRCLQSERSSETRRFSDKVGCKAKKICNLRVCFGCAEDWGRRPQSGGPLPGGIPFCV